MGSSHTPHFIYTIRDAAREIIYIGQTADVRKRFNVHRSLSTWWSDFHDVEVVEVDRYAAAKEEARLIEIHKPKHNVYYVQKSYRSFFSEDDYETLARMASERGIKPHQIISEVVTSHLRGAEAA